MNFEIRSFDVFGKSSQAKLSWRNELKKKGAAAVMAAGSSISKDIASNVDASYYTLAGIILEDLDSSIQYFLSFVNGKKMWALDLANVENPKSPEAEVDIEFKIKVFHDPFIKKVIARSYEILLDAKAVAASKLLPEVQAGNLLEVDETKLEAVLFCLNDKMLMQNLKKGTYLK